MWLLWFQLDDCTLQLSHNGTYLDLESTLDEQKDELEGFQQETGSLEYQAGSTVAVAIAAVQP
ncbi:UNVERIFIED_CONTAM: hypothetical protein FKN15_064889 [Acipenser sinensis]